MKSFENIWYPAGSSQTAHAYNVALVGSGTTG